MVIDRRHFGTSARIFYTSGRRQKAACASRGGVAAKSATVVAKERQQAAESIYSIPPLLHRGVE
jgi:hypothetical protein